MSRKELAGFIIGALLAALLWWVGGYDFDKREPWAAVVLMTSALGGLLGLVFVST